MRGIEGEERSADGGRRAATIRTTCQCNWQCHVMGERSIAVGTAAWRERKLGGMDCRGGATEQGAGRKQGRACCLPAPAIAGASTPCPGQA